MTAPKPQPGEPAPRTTAQPPASSGATATMDSVLEQYSAPWLGSGNYWKRVFQTPSTKVSVKPPVMLKDYVVDGKLTLSLRNYLDLVLANNTDISVQRLGLEIPKNAIERAFSVFDPLLTSSFGATRATTPATNTLQGAAVVSNLNQPFNLRFQETLPTSTVVFSTLNWSKLSTNDAFSIFNPAYTNTWQMGFTQPLIRNRGKYITKLPITVARAAKLQQDFSVNDSVQRLLVTAENSYWDVISARETLKVNREALKLAEAALERTNKEIELGATSELERFQPEQNAAAARINVTRTEFLLKQTEDVLRRQIGADLDPDVRTLPIVLTEDVSPKVDSVMYEPDKLVSAAFENRMDLRAQRATLDVNDLNIKNAMNGMKPLLNLSAFYQTYGRGGPGYIRNVTPPIFVPGGAGDAWGQMFEFGYNTWNFSLNLNLPLRDHVAAANLSDAAVNKKIAVLRERALQQQIRQEVLNAITNVESSREGIKLAQIALDYSRKRAEADQKRYDLGVINIFFLLQAQNDLATAESNLVNQTVLHKRNLLNLSQRTGMLLTEKGLVIQ